MNRKCQRRPIKAKSPRQPRTVSRPQAAKIARTRIAQDLVTCAVRHHMPAGIGIYGRRLLPKNCWYVVCGATARNMLDGRKTLLCVSKKTGRVLYRTVIQSGG